MSGCKLIVDGAAGIYVPQYFIEGIHPGVWEGIETWAAASLFYGPDDEEYWNAWYEVEMNAHFIDEDGHTWILYQDQDLFLVCADLMTEEEKKTFWHLL